MNQNLSKGRRMDMPIKDSQLFRPYNELPELVSLIKSPAYAGFPSPAGDYLEERLDLHKLLITNHAATYIFPVKGSSMEAERIMDGDLLIVDTSLEVKSGDIILGVLDGGFIVKRMVVHQDHIVLVSIRSGMAPILVKPERDFEVWGKVIYSIHRHK
jgi:DNA polymerase V